MRYVLRAVSVVLCPIAFWVLVVWTGFGAHSLSQILEVPMIILLSVGMDYYLRDRPLYEVLFVLFLMVLLVRFFMPGIPE